MEQLLVIVFGGLGYFVVGRLFKRLTHVVKEAIERHHHQ